MIRQYEVPPTICCVHDVNKIASVVSVGEEFEVVPTLQATQTNQDRYLGLEPVAFAFHSSMPLWLGASCVLLCHLERFSFSSPGSVCTKHNNVSNDDGATDVADMCCLKLSINVGLSWFSLLVLRKSGGNKRGTQKP